ncbi:MAG: hypothetical protein CMJ94_00730 [Planctomycetes bacterium]|nr:hypothetical protein [Planctomycetota bacterium]
MSDFDLVLHGATGFTGRLAAREIARTAEPGLRWAISGRSEAKLQELSSQLGVPRLLTDGAHPAACEQTARRARVVLSCAGPFQLYGSHLLRACAESGTHYADLSGEIGWIWEMIRDHHDTARRTGAVILPASGFDSVPSDLAAQTLVRDLQQKEVEVGELTGFFRLKGGLNGGTLASGLAQSELHSPEELAHPFLLDPDPQQSWAERLLPPDRPEVFPAGAAGGFACPFVMAPVNERLVRRSAALAEEHGRGYGDEFSYAEFLRSSSEKQAKQLATGTRLGRWALGAGAAARPQTAAPLRSQAGKWPRRAHSHRGLRRTDDARWSDRGTCRSARLVFPGRPRQYGDGPLPRSDRPRSGRRRSAGSRGADAGHGAGQPPGRSLARPRRPARLLLTEHLRPVVLEAAQADAAVAAHHVAMVPGAVPPGAVRVAARALTFRDVLCSAAGARLGCAVTRSLLALHR